LKRIASAWRCIVSASPAIKSYLPRIRARKLKTAALFPGYAFVLIELQWHSARWSPGVPRLVLDGMQPAKVPDKVITELKGRERNGLVELPSPLGLRRGDTVRITCGVFAGQLAVFNGMRAHERVAVLLQLLGRVELPKGDIAPAP
jgi:transcriptional antiterminator RfaH